MTKCSRNLSRHIQLLKAEHNRLLAMQLNGEKLDKTETESYLLHRRYVETLLQNEKFKSANQHLINKMKQITK